MIESNVTTPSVVSDAEMGGRGGLEVRQLTRKIADFTLTADFRLSRGERMVIQASSGAGKSSLLRTIAGLDAPDSGSVWLGGRDLTRVAPPAREIGFVFQDAALFGSMSVAENAAFGLRMRGVGKAERLAQASRWLAKVGLAARADSGVGHLSGGERQRLAFVRALIWQPRLLLLDEPFSALDLALRQGLRHELRELLDESPVPMILVTHDREDADELATQRWGISEESQNLRCLTRQD